MYIPMTGEHILKKNLYANAHNSFIHNSQDVGPILIVYQLINEKSKCSIFK